MKKTIIIPINKKAEKLLDFDNVDSSELVEVILDNEDFEKLWNEGVFSLINEICNSLIDEFEDEHIYDLNLIEKSYTELKNKYPNANNIINAFKQANYYRTSIHFYF